MMAPNMAAAVRKVMITEVVKMEFLKRLKGIIGSLALCSAKMKAAKETAATANMLRMMLEPQACSRPPQESASISGTKVVTSRPAPQKSITLSLMVETTLGMVKAMTPRAIRPRGRLT